MDLSVDHRRRPGLAERLDQPGDPGMPPAAVTMFSRRSVRRSGTESSETPRWREMDSNRRSSAEFGNFVLAGVSFGVPNPATAFRTVPAMPSVVPLRRRMTYLPVMMSAQSPPAHVALVADLSTSCSDSQATSIKITIFIMKRKTPRFACCGSDARIGNAPLVSGFGVRF